MHFLYFFKTKHSFSSIICLRTNNRKDKIHSELVQVIGLQNKTETDRLFRPYKQVTERLNRTFKQEAYLTMNGFNSLNTANGYLTLFAAYFNFLRRHESLNWQNPVEISEIKDCPHMPAKWIYFYFH